MRTTIARWVVVTLAFAGLGYLYSNQLTATHALSAQNTALVAQIESLGKVAIRAQERRIHEGEVLVAREVKIVVQARKTAVQTRVAETALQRNIEWSDTDVPQDVQNALYGASSGLPEPAADGLFDSEGDAGAVSGEGEPPTEPAPELPDPGGELSEEPRLG